jgi:hypothetical protein
MGDSALPRPTEWKAMGRTTHNAMQTAVVQIRFMEELVVIGQNSLYH